MHIKKKQRYSVHQINWGKLVIYKTTILDIRNIILREN